MEFKQSLNLGITPEQQRENYDKSSSERALVSKTFLEKLLGKGSTKEDVIVADAKAEDKYRSLLKDGKISNDEFNYLTENNVEIRTEGLGIISSKDIIEGMVNGNRVMVSRKIVGGDDNYDEYSYTAQINGQDIELSEKEGSTLYDELITVFKKKEAILGKIAQDEAKELVGDK